MLDLQMPDPDPSVTPINTSATRGRALVASAVVAGVSGIFGPPDLVTMILNVIGAFIGITIVFLICLRIFSIATWSLLKQRLLIWLIAVAMGFAIFCWQYS